MTDSKTKPDGLKCRICGHVEQDFLGDHLLEAHGMTASKYLDTYPDAGTVSQRLHARFQQTVNPRKRAHPPKPTSLKVKFGRIEFPVNVDVPVENCLPMPDHYRIPRYGLLGEDVEHAVVSLFFKRSIYVWGLPGSGKDALFHAWSNLTRTPAMIRQVKPGTDIEAWFFSRGFTEAGTHWEEGEALKALRDGFVTPTGRRIPYMMLVTDFDRADREQAEHLRLITDSIQGRIDGPAGKVYPVLPGTLVAATGNTAGSGDERGRMISANPIDASLLDRFEKVFQFRWMDWRDEESIVRAKFPVLAQRVGDTLFEKMGKVTKSLREAILDGELYGEFSHRGLCSILMHAEDMLECNGSAKVPKNLLKLASRSWLDRLPDEENRESAIKIMDPHISMLDVGKAPPGSTVGGFKGGR